MTTGEFGLIERWLKPLASGFPGALGLTDDAALVECRQDSELVIAKDAIVENIHFLSDDPPMSVARKLLRTNLSDLAAMGAEPVAYLTALMLPEHVDDAWIAAFVSGLEQDQKAFGLHLIGGDITSTRGPIALSCTIIGRVPKGLAVSRSGARPGDQIWVSGHLGDAALGLRIRQGLAADEDTAMILLGRYRLPRPRVKLGQRLRDIATAMIDVSDGLVADLGHIAECSGTSAVIDAALLPISDDARDVPGAREAALSGGDDYELLFCAPPEATPTIEAIGAELELPVTRIGQVASGQGVRVFDETGTDLPLQRMGWQHR
jgi:thiamine-monophosphate kinase